MGCGCSSTGLMPIQEAQTLISNTVTTISETEQIDVTDCIDRVISEDVISPINVPAYDNSAMDGYALRVKDLSDYAFLTLVGKSFAGKPYDGELGSGECVRIMTGAQIPKGSDAVVMQENAEVKENQVSILKCSGVGEAIRSKGDDINQGQVVLAKGNKVSAIDIGVLTSLGLSKLRVFRKLKVAVFSTGDELLKAGDTLKSGCIFDTNRPMLVAMLTRLGAQVLDLGIISDSKDKIKDAFQYANTQADCVITSGGVSVGEADFTKEVLDEIGEIDFWKLAIKPGKPLAFGKLPNSFFFGLPGNPVSAAVTFDKIALPALRLMSGEQAKNDFLIPATTISKFKKRPGRTDYQRAFCEVNDNGELIVSSHKTQSSGVLSSFVQSNCYVVLEQERGSVEIGESVQVSLFNSPLL